MRNAALAFMAGFGVMAAWFESNPWWLAITAVAAVVLLINWLMARSQRSKPVYHQTGQKIGPCLSCGIDPDDAPDKDFWTGNPSEVTCRRAVEGCPRCGCPTPAVCKPGECHGIPVGVPRP